MQIFADKKFQNPIEIIKAFDRQSFIEAFLKIEKYRKTHYLLGYIRYEAKDIFSNNLELQATPNPNVMLNLFQHRTSERPCDPETSSGRRNTLIATQYKNIKSDTPLLYFEVFENYEKYIPNLATEIRLQKKSLIDFNTYEKAIKKIKTQIVCGNTYQLNYTYDWELNTNVGGIVLYESLLAKQTTPYNAYIKNEFEEILSFSPELFFELENNIIKTKPMKGTVKRGGTKEEDEKNIEFLKNDNKNRAENVMIVDLLRNDLGKIAKTGSVKVDKLFEIETHKTLHQMTSEVTAELVENISLYEIFEAIFPCGSVTGAPKINTMEIIEEIERGKREVYCGAIGLISPDKTVFSVPIRILQRKSDEKTYKYRVGGAIVWDSTVNEEWQETFTKIKFLDDNIKLVETIKVENLELIDKTAHFNRMKKSAKALGFEFNPELLNIRAEKDGILRVLLSKDGEFETEYLPLNPISTNKITVSEITVSSCEPMLYHKTTYRPWYEKSMEKIKRGEVFDEIFFNEKNELTEGARSNLVLKIGEELYTPPRDCGLLSGVFRQKMLNSSTLIERKLYPEDLKRAKKIYCVNSVRGIVEVELA